MNNKVSYTHQYLSRTETFEKKMEDFSAGQKKKVLIAKSLCEQAHLYVWDEPLNYVELKVTMNLSIYRLVSAFIKKLNFSQIITLTRKLNSEKSLTVIVKKKNTIKSYQKSQLKRKSYS